MADMVGGMVDERDEIESGRCRVCMKKKRKRDGNRLNLYFARAAQIFSQPGPSLNILSGRADHGPDPLSKASAQTREGAKPSIHADTGPIIHKKADIPP